MEGLNAFAHLLGVRPALAEDALHSERTARALLSRRGLFVGGIVTAGYLLVGGPLPLHVFTDDAEWFVAHNLADAHEVRAELYGATLEPELYPLDELPDHERMGIWSDSDGHITEHGDDGGTVIRRTMADWCQREGRGFLCTTEA